jgi:predicted ATPase
MSRLSNTSVLDTAMKLPAAYRRLDLLDQSAGKRVAADADALFRKIGAIEDAAIATPAKTLADAAVQIMLAYSRNEECADSSPNGEKHRQISVALHSALVIVAAAAKLNLNRVAADEYLIEATHPSERGRSAPNRIAAILDAA